MADHRATWVRLREVARLRYPSDNMAAEAAARALCDAEEVASYAADLDARAEEQDILDTTRAATRLRGELRKELRAEGSGAGGTEEEYVHLDDADLDADADDIAYLEPLTDEEAAEFAAEQRALMVSFETQRRNKSARRLMVAERRAAADYLATARQSSRRSAYLRNLVAADELRALAAADELRAGRRPWEDRARVEAERRLQYERARAAELAIVRTPIPFALLLYRHRHRRRCPTPPPGIGVGRTPPPSPGDRQPSALRPFRRGQLRRPVAIGSITDILAVYTPLEYQFCLFLLRTQICKIYLILMKSSKFNENFANIKFQIF
jgi:hypothetical protein